VESFKRELGGKDWLEYHGRPSSDIQAPDNGGRSPIKHFMFPVCKALWESAQNVPITMRLRENVDQVRNGVATSPICLGTLNVIIVPAFLIRVLLVKQ
jgi:hypothetical protein